MSQRKRKQSIVPYLPGKKTIWKEYQYENKYVITIIFITIYKVFFFNSKLFTLRFKGYLLWYWFYTFIAWPLNLKYLYLMVLSYNYPIFTCKNAIPTATPATSSKLFSSHSSPAVIQPFSFTILWISSIYTRK